MIELVASKRSEIAAICRLHGIQSMWLFGSAPKGTWEASSSDLDFLVDLGEHDVRYARRLMRTIVDLERLFGVQVDVTTTEQAISEWFRQELDATKELVFEAERASMTGSRPESPGDRVAATWRRNSRRYVAGSQPPMSPSVLGIMSGDIARCAPWCHQTVDARASRLYR